MLVFDLLVEAQKKLRRVFWGGEMTWLIEGGLVPLLGPLLAPLHAAYEWGTANLLGVAVHWPGPLGARLEILVAQDPVPGFAALLARLLPLVPMRVVVTGAVQFAQSPDLGGKIAIEEQPGGRIGLFLKDSAGASYALTCAHVLDAEPSNQPVVSGVSRIGNLAFRNKLLKGLNNPQAKDPDEPNQVDCALAKLASTAVTNVLPSDGSPISEMGDLVVGQSVNIVKSDSLKAGTVKSNNLDIWFPYDGGRLYFNDLTMITGDHDLQPGDSGSLVISDNRKAVALAIGYSKFGLTTDHPPQKFGSIGVLCDLRKIHAALMALVGSPLSLA